LPAVNARALATLVAVASVASPDLRDGVRDVYESARRRLRGGAAASPGATLAGAVIASAAAFYGAERGSNPQVRTYEDALVFVAACLTAGYSNIVARTPAGKALAAWLMGVGPALAPAPAARGAAGPRGLNF
jgi:voltage-gated potassium channel